MIDECGILLLVDARQSREGAKGSNWGTDDSLCDTASPKKSIESQFVDVGRPESTSGQAHLLPFVTFASPEQGNNLVPLPQHLSPIALAMTVLLVSTLMYVFIVAVTRSA